MMPDDRDFRIKMDLAFPSTAGQYADRIRNALAPFFQNAIIINEGEEFEERGFIDIHKCGHNLGESCEVIARWEVGRGRVI